MLSISAKKIHYLRNNKFLPMSYQTSMTGNQTNNHISVVKFIQMILKGSWLDIIFVTFAATLSDFIDFAYGPVISQWLVRTLENFTGEKNELLNVLIKPIIIALLIWIIPDLIWRSGSWLYSKKIDPTMDAKIKITFLDRTMKNSYEFFTNHSTGYAMSSLYKILFSIKCIVKKISREIIPHTVTCMAMLSSLIALHWSLFAIMMIYVLLYALIFIFSYKYIFHLQGKMVDAYTKNTANITDVVMNFASVLLFSRKKYEISRAKRIQHTECQRIENSNLFLEKLKIARVLLCFLFCGVLFYADILYFYINGIVNLADVVYALTSTGACIALVNLLQEDFLDIIAEFGVTQEGLNILNSGKIADTTEGGSELKVSKGSINIVNLSFDYHGNEIFNQQNLNIKAGEKVGLVGRSGAGKTTLINLILRNLTPSDGKITIDNQDIAFATDSSLKNCISVVSQDTTLFNRSVLDNIKYSKPDATMEEVVEAAKRANVHDFIETLSLGYNTNVGEKGMLLSGGQRQRILIARAILKNAPILILDEATSALDAENEKFIQDGLDKLMQGKTVIAIAHKLNTLKEMDRIIVLQDGKIEEQGSHYELINKKDGLYKKLWDIQKATTIMMED